MIEVATGISHIYDLTDPRDGLPFYVGQAFNLEQRLAAHLSDREGSEKAARIRELRSLGLEPIQRLLETIEGTQADADDREMFWIKKYLGEGIHLTNRRIGIKKKRYTTYLPEELADRLKVYAARHHDDMSGIIERLVEHFLDGEGA